MKGLDVINRFMFGHGVVIYYTRNIINVHIRKQSHSRGWISYQRQWFAEFLVEIATPKIRFCEAVKIKKKKTDLFSIFSLTTVKILF